MVVQLRPIALNDAPKVQALQTSSIGQLMFPISKQEIHDLLAGGQGCIIGAWLGEALIAFLAITLPDLGENNLGHDAGLPQHQLSGLAQWTAVVVHPDYRGKGLQVVLLHYSLHQLDWPQVRRWLATVRCDNEFSLRNFRAVGARVVKTIRKYDGHLRFLLLLELPTRSG